MAEYLYHFSEDPSIKVFVPRVAPTQQVVGAYVWADAQETSPRYWFPRECPRGTWWPSDGSGRVHAIQSDWLDRFVAVSCTRTASTQRRFGRTRRAVVG
jgi:hypothetical protein